MPPGDDQGAALPALRERARALRELVFLRGELQRVPDLLRAEATLEAAEQGDAGKIVSAPTPTGLLGPETTGLEVEVDLRLAQVPTALVHLLGHERTPLVSFRVRNRANQTKRLRLVSYVEGYSAQAVDTREVELGHPVVVDQFPTFFPAALREVTELTRATLNVLVEDLDARTELHQTKPVWLLARTTAPLRVKDPKDGRWIDLTPYLGAFVTPNHPEVMRFLRSAVQHAPGGRFIGYQVGAQHVEPQVEAIYRALRESGVVYVNSLVDFAVDGATFSQRVRRPAEALADRMANCIDGVLLFASLLEAISLNPAIVIVPGHAFLAWQTWPQQGWTYLETTMLASDDFAAACGRGAELAASFDAAHPQPGRFHSWPLPALRARGINPLDLPARHPGR
jgi:hypothetical protein